MFIIKYSNYILTFFWWLSWYVTLISKCKIVLHFFSICLSWNFMWMWKWQKNVELWGFLRQFFGLSLHSWNFRLKHVGMHNCAFRQDFEPWQFEKSVSILMSCYLSKFELSVVKANFLNFWCLFNLLFDLETSGVR